MITPIFSVQLEAYNTTVYSSNDPSSSLNGKTVEEGSGKYIILNKVLEFRVQESVNTITTTASILIPDIYTSFNEGRLFIKRSRNADVFLIKPDSQFKVRIYAGFNSLEKVFEGVITTVERNDATSIRINCEDNMNFLKRNKQLKFSFNSPIQKEAPYLDRFIGDRMNLWHLMKYVFGSDELIRTRFSKVYCQDLEIGKIKANDYMFPATILQLIKDRFGLSVYSIKNELFIGYKTNSQSEWVDVYKTIDTGVKTLYRSPSSKVMSFSYPYDKNYNRVIDHSLVWNNTNKEECISAVRSFQDINNTTIIRYYPESRATYQEEYNTHKDKYDLTLQTKTITEDDYINLIENSTNKIEVNIPNLTESECDKIAKDNYDKFKNSGYTGNFKTFGEPIVRLNDKVLFRLNNSTIDGLNDVSELLYYIESIERSFSISEGLIQIFIIGNRV